MEQQWLIVCDEVLIEREATGARDCQWRVNSKDTFRNFMHIRAGLTICNGHQTLLMVLDDGSIGHCHRTSALSGFLELQSNLNIQKTG
jgi:hypothetical protein